MEKRRRIEEALKEIGIYTVEDLNRAIKEEKPLDLGIMTGQAATMRKAGYMDTKGNRIIAVDFDGTLHTGTWPEIGDVNMTVFNFCRNEQSNGARLILWTNRVGEQLEDAVAWCKERGLEFDAVNENLPELIELYGNDCRKINADIYIDDKAVNPMRRRQIAGLTSLNPYDNPTDREVFAQIQKQKEAERRLRA